MYTEWRGEMMRIPQPVLMTLIVAFGLVACAPTGLPARDGDAAPAVSTTALVAAVPTPTVLTQEPDPAKKQFDAPSTPTSVALTQEPDLARSLPRPPLLLATLAPTDLPIVGEAPAEAMDRVLADLEQRLGSRPDAVQIVRSEAVTWNDGSLGCPRPGVFYTQAPVEGYWIIVKVGTTTYDYRMGAPRALPMLCESPQPRGGSGRVPPTAVIVVPDRPLPLPKVTPVKP
jgi:hypothetical protein